MKAFLKSFVYAWNGVRLAFKGHRNFKIQLAIAIAVIAASFCFRLSVAEWCVVLLTIALVLSLEMVNTAMENLVNLVTQEYHPLAGKVKDIAAGAVLLASVLAFIIGSIIFYHHIKS